MADTYKETILRYRVCKRYVYDMSNPDDLQRRAEMIINGIDPDTEASLIWSFNEKEKAEAKLAYYIEQEAEMMKKYGRNLYHYFIIDNGSESVIERSAWL